MVKYKDRSTYINPTLLDLQDCWDRLELIRSLHKTRFYLEDLLENCEASDIESLLKKWEEIQFKLQKAWGFEKNAKFHKFWEIPGCSCPKLDSEDSYPSGYYYVSQECKYHGGSK